MAAWRAQRGNETERGLLIKQERLWRGAVWQLPHDPCPLCHFCLSESRLNWLTFTDFMSQRSISTYFLVAVLYIWLFLHLFLSSFTKSYMTPPIKILLMFHNKSLPANGLWPVRDQEVFFNWKHLPSGAATRWEFSYWLLKLWQDWCYWLHRTFSKIKQHLQRCLSSISYIWIQTDGEPYVV